MTAKEIFAEKVRNEFSKKNIIVIGDLMVDEYILGKVTRISPEAPVPVLNFRERRLEAGGASNVAHNIRTLGASVAVMGTAADDEAGRWLREHLAESGIHTDGILAEAERPTTLKTRFATKGQQLIRVDSEDSRCISEETQERLLRVLQDRIGGYDAVVLSDYRKGVLNGGGFVRKIISLCNGAGVPVAADSKSRDIGVFAGMDFVKPNNLELEEAVGIKIEDDDDLERAGRSYLERSGAKALVVTRGARGISVFIPGSERRDFASRAVQVFDVTGAGDTVISTVVLGVASGLDLYDSVRLANLAAGIVVSKVGTAAVTRDELLERIRNEK